MPDLLKRKLSTVAPPAALPESARAAFLLPAAAEPVAAKRATTAPVSVVAAWLAPFLGGGPPNTRPDYQKGVRYLTTAESLADPFGGAALDAVDPLTCALFTEVVVEFYRPQGEPLTMNQVLVAVYDPQGPLTVYRDGNFTAGETVPARWVKRGEAETFAPAYATRGPAYSWGAGEYMRSYAGGATENFFKRKAPGGTAPDATSAAGDANWEVVSREQVIGELTRYLRPGSATGAGNIILGPPGNGNDIAGTSEACTMNGGSGSTLTDCLNSSAIDAQDSSITASESCSFNGVNSCGLTNCFGSSVYRGEAVYLTDCFSVVVINTVGLTLTGVSNATYIDGVLQGTGASGPTRDPYDVPQAVMDAVVAGTFSSGELQGAQPAGSEAGHEFTTASYGYKYQRGAAGTLVWNRFIKS